MKQENGSHDMNLQMMDARQSSYFSTDKTPQPDRQSVIDRQSVTDRQSVAEQTRGDQPSRTGHLSAVPSRTGLQSAALSQKDQSSKPKSKSPADIKQSKNQSVKEAENKSSGPVKQKITKIDEENPGKPPKIVNAKIDKKEEKKVQIKLEPEIKKKQFAYPIPKPPPTRKADIFNIEMAREIDTSVKKVNIEAFSDMKTFTKRITIRLYKDVEKVRAIFAWICLQKLDQLDFSRATNKTCPLYELKQVKTGKSSYPELFVTMCKAIEIPCYVVTGVAKLEDHKIGDTEIDKNKVTWNAVYCADGWRIVFFQWALEKAPGPDKHPTTQTTQKPQNQIVKPASSMKGGSFKDGSSSIPKLPEIESSKSTRTPSRATPQSETQFVSQADAILKTFKFKPIVQEEVILDVDEYYFLTDPDEFIFTCFPDEDSWQLLGRPYSIEKFLLLPVLTEAFFVNELKIPSRLFGIRKAKHGSCTISIKRMGPHDIVLYHTLELLEPEEKGAVLPCDATNLVVVAHEDAKTNFIFRFPIAGVYEFKAHGGKVGEEMKFLCSFRIRCDEPKVRFEQLHNVPEIGFGASYLTQEFGLELIPTVNGLIPLRGPDTCDIQFKVTKNIKVIAEMLYSDFSPEELEDFIDLKHHNEDLFITVGVPKNGEYVLQLMAKPRNSDADFINVCNFLLTSDDPKKPRKTYEDASMVFVRKQLLNTLRTSKSPNDVKNAIDRLNKEDINDDELLAKAYERLEYLQRARELRKGINGKNIDLLDRAIQNAKQSSVVEKLENFIEEGEKILREANPTYILDMKRTTISEIHRYKIPKDVMFDVMKATYLLLGENEKSLQTWEDIVYLMKFTSRKSLLYKVKHFNKSNVPKSVIPMVSRLLKPHTFEEARTASLGVGTFYQWATDIVRTVDMPAVKPEQKREAKHIPPVTIDANTDKL